MSKKELIQKRNTYIAQAKDALLRGDVKKGVELRQKAEQTAEAIKEYDALADLVKSELSSGRPPLPGTDGGTMVKPANGANGADGKAADQDASAAAYVMRFGTPEASVKAILRDLHGDNYEGLYWRQRAAFGKYIRYGKEEMDREELRLLKSIILTPDLIKAQIVKGIDTVDAIKATMVEAIDTLGGFAVPVDFQAKVIERLQGLTVMRGRASVDTTSRDMVEIPVSTGGDDQYSSAVRVTWVDETPVAGAAATNLTFGLEGIPIHTVMAETGLSRNMVEDSAFDIENYLTRKFAEASAIDEDNQFLVGNGVGKPQGILPGSTNVLGLTEKISGSAAALTWDGLIDMVYAVPTQYRKNAVWIANRSTYGAIAKFRDSTSGNYLWNPFQYAGGAEGAPPKLLGYEVLEQEAMPDVAANAYPIIFGDLAAYQIFDRVGMTVERYLDSQTARQNMIMYVVRRRLGAQLVEPWRMAVQKVAAPAAG